MVTIIRSEIDVYKEAYKKMKFKCEIAEAFNERYEQQIDNFFKTCHCYKDIQDWYQKLDDEFSDRYSAIVFLCYEKPSDFCHRHILREIFAHKYMIRVDKLECQSNLEINENKSQSTPKALF